MRPRLSPPVTFMVALAALPGLAACGGATPHADAGDNSFAPAPSDPPAPTDLASSSDAGLDALPPLTCGEGRIAKMIGQPENEANHAAVVAAVGHRHIRWVHPGEAVTMDYQAGRLNVIVDEAGKIAATRCG